MIFRSTHEALMHAMSAQISTLEDEVRRLQSENRDLVNAIAINGRQVAPFERHKPALTAVVPGRKSVFQLEKELERAEAIPASQ